jgi:serine/threonine protein kinase
MDFTVENLCGLIMRSKLLPPDEVRALHQRWAGLFKDGAAAAPPAFLRWLVANGHLTEYQANLIARGQADDFFLNQYRILDRLGRGRMAGVYKAVHQLGQVVAIKVLPPSRAKDPPTLARFQREARMAVKLKHPNVVRSFQVGEANGLHYLVMEYLDGETLDETLQRRKRLPPQEAVRVVHQALGGLQHVHEQGLVHRDLKPANLMLVPARQPGEPDTTLTGTVKILDIGLGRELFDESGRAAARDLQLTGEGVLLGTPEYLAPEQARDPHRTDVRADIYSLGCVLYHCLAGQPPFPDSNALNQMIRHATEPPRPLKELNPAVPDGLQQIVNWMLAKDPAQRYPTPERAAQALQVFLSAGGAPSRKLEEAPQMRRYLTWLETGAADGKDEPRLAHAVPVAASPTAPKAPEEPATHKRDARGQREHPRKRKRHKHGLPPPPVALPVSPPPPPGADEFDVELVTMPPPAPQPARGGFGLSRRDWMLLGAGAGGVIVAVLIGMLFAVALK